MHSEIYPDFEDTAAERQMGFAAAPKAGVSAVAPGCPRWLQRKPPDLGGPRQSGKGLPQSKSASRFHAMGVVGWTRAQPARLVRDGASPPKGIFTQTEMRPFLNEAGDTTLYGKGKQLILGTEGVSPTLGITLVRIDCPLTEVRAEITALRNRLKPICCSTPFPASSSAPNAAGSMHNVINNCVWRCI